MALINKNRAFRTDVKPQIITNHHHSFQDYKGRHGADIRAYMVENHVRPYLESRIKAVVRFAKKIPGFTALPLVDQVSLIKGT